ncbi:hypothetical protein HAPAU_35070 [Halalkalicoccus paucihalophilus]|uniref:Cytochrome C oxidase subunit I n=1 Tax=Halalkalicoccus paucihalophilus TaxID=1008153 RepID=A0A151AAA3_9EURY|nr:DUF6789 family protein [Halalkalicoccus paucihalophilus]KYH24524.1 hypothetical protein HAPAU_35070 [Halalkalicoccus paucihalophilus]
MSKEPNPKSTITGEEPALDEAGLLITFRVIAIAMGGGLLGMLLMLPLLGGVPIVFNIFQTESIIEFAQFGGYLGFEPSLAVGIVLFVVGGATILPVLFLIAGAFLPPEEPRYLRGMTFASITWVGFLFAFWPTGGLLTVGLFIIISLVSHWIYGITLGYVLHRTVGIPQHSV